MNRLRTLPVLLSASLMTVPAFSADDGHFCIKNAYHGKYLSDGPEKLADNCGYTETWVMEETSATSGYCIKNEATGKYLSDIHPDTYDRCSAGELWQLEPIATPSQNELQISSQIDTFGQSLYGVSGVHPLTATLSFATESPTPLFMPAQAGSPDFTKDLYGYALEDIESLTVQFGDKTWSKDNIQERIPAPGYSAAIWLDAEWGGSEPINKIWLYVDDNNGIVDIGGAGCNASQCELLGNVYVDQYYPDHAMGQGILEVQTGD